MKRFLYLLKTEPVVWQGVLQLVVALVAKFGFQVSTTQLTGITVITTPVFSIVVRSLVTPTIKLPPPPQ